MTKIHRAGRILGGIIIVAGVIGVLGTAGGSDQGTLSLSGTFYGALGCMAAIGLGWVIYKLNTPQAVRRRAIYRFKRDVDLLDETMAQVWHKRHGDWWDQIPTGNCRRTNLRPIRPVGHR